MIGIMPISVQKNMEGLVHVNVVTYARLVTVLLQGTHEAGFEYFTCPPPLAIRVQIPSCTGSAFAAEVDFTSAAGLAKLS